jgi:hypothetical protein
MNIQTAYNAVMKAKHGAIDLADPDLAYSQAMDKFMAACVDEIASLQADVARLEAESGLAKAIEPDELSPSRPFPNDEEIAAMHIDDALPAVAPE